MLNIIAVTTLLQTFGLHRC